MRIAIVCDWLVTYAGAERVLEAMLQCFPEANLFAVVDFLQDRDFIQHKAVTTSFIQHLPRAKTKYRAYLPLMPLAIEQLDLSAYDVIISSSHAVAKGIITGPNQLHISYVHSPMRYAWDLQFQYLRESGLTRGLKSWLTRYLLHKLRIWDARTANGVDVFVANSKFIARRIAKIYRREALVIYPPVDVDNFEFCADKQDYYVTASRMVPYKKMDLIVEAFAAMPDKRLVVIGTGPDAKKVRAKAEGKANIEFLGYLAGSELKTYMQNAKAFVFAAEEDFGITPVEAMACGTPVIAYAKGGALETVKGLNQAEPTGVFFAEQTVSSLREAVKVFEQHAPQIHPIACREQALKFASQCFNEQFKQCVMREWQAFCARS